MVEVAQRCKLTISPPWPLGEQNFCLNRTMFGMTNQDEGCFGIAVAWDVSAAYKLPDGLASEDAGPLMCGGATVWGPLYEEGARPGDRVGIVGIGGLGHLAIQFAAKMGLEVVVFSSSAAKKEEAFKFGASEFYVTGDENFKGVKPVDYFLITSSFLPDLSP